MWLYRNKTKEQIRQLEMEGRHKVSEAKLKVKYGDDVAKKLLKYMDDAKFHDGLKDAWCTHLNHVIYDASNLEKRNIIHQMEDRP